MKFKLIFLLLILVNLKSYAQSKNSVALVFGIANNDVNIFGAIGDYGYNPKSGTMVGLAYTRNLSRAFAIETGIIYSDNKVELNTIGPAAKTVSGNVDMITIPVMAKFTFLKYVYVDGGALLDKQTNYTNNSVIRDQSGIGLQFGIGGKYDVGNITFFLNPFISEHGVVNFNDQGLSGSLMESGLKFGVGYNF